MKNFELLNSPLTVDQIEFRVDRLVEYSDTVYCFILAYKNARIDMQVLDAAVGQLDWQVEYHRDTNGVLQCGIGIYDEMKQQWVWKWSNGTESNQDPSKGEYSDAFKRAGFMWGIGRQLYEFPEIRVQLTEKEYRKDNDKIRATGYLKPNNWKWQVSSNYKDVKAWSFPGGNKALRFDSKPNAQ